MKLLRLKAAGFGPLRGEYRFDPDRVTLMVDENERGKSSLLAAIAAALYGLDDDRRSHRVITPLERWRPWDAGGYRVELDFEWAGGRITVVRDFDRNTVEVWNDRGQEVTADYRHGKDDFPIGKKLFDLDAGEFERCAFIRHGELDQVIPGEERDRRASTLHARLESAADAGVGDVNAIESIRVLQEAAAAYSSPELETSLKIDNVIQRLEAKRDLLATEIATLEHDLEQNRGPLEELARLTEEERAARECLGRLEAQRRALRLADARRELRQDEQRRAEIEKQKREAEALRDHGDVRADAQAELLAAVARHEEARRSLDAVVARRRENADQRRRFEAENAGLSVYAACSAADADLMAARSEEIRRLDAEHDRLRAEFERSREELSARGYELRRVELLTARFGSLSSEQQDLLRTHPAVALQHQTEVAASEQARTESTATLRAIDSTRHARRIPGWLILAAGLGAALAAGVAGSLQTAWPWLPMLAGGALLVIAGAILLWVGSNARESDREAALVALREAEQRLNRLRAQWTEHQGRLEALASSMRYTHSEGLLREWRDYGRLIEESGPAQQSQHQITALETRRQRLIEETEELLGRAGGGPADPTHLDLTAAGVRQFHAVRQRLEDFDHQRARLEEDERRAEDVVSELKSAAIRILASAGLPYDPHASWADHVEMLAERTRASARHAQLTRELIPEKERALLTPEALKDLRDRIERAESETPPGGATEPPARPLGEIEAEIERLRAASDDLARQRGERKVEVEQKARLGQAGRATKQAERERVERALERARRFKLSVELAIETIQEAASDTHRRWAEFLNQRVGVLLGQVGAGIQQVRFGDDLDFSIRLPDGAQISRGKAVHQLSSGACDQLHLVVRLAISEYLSRGREPLPLLIDDAFASSDDQRTREGMRLLIEDFAPRHQIVLMTCHRKRFEALADWDRDLYAGRVTWIDSSAVTMER